MKKNDDDLMKTRFVTTFEYKRYVYIYADIHTVPAEVLLNDFGSNGWELINIHYPFEDRDTEVWTFQRPNGLKILE
jgi:hypothetical protein